MLETAIFDECSMTRYSTAEGFLLKRTKLTNFEYQLEVQEWSTSLIELPTPRICENLVIFILSSLEHYPRPDHMLCH